MTSMQIALTRCCVSGAAAVLVLAVVQGGGAGAAVSACTPAHLAASMTVIDGSAGAGHISYAVRVKNAGGTACTVSGRPGLLLLGKRKHALPTHVVADHPGTGTAALVTLTSGKVARAEARFSPDIPSSGEPASGPCERKAHFVRVSLASPGSGALMGPVRPPTPVCGHGRIVLGLLHA